MKFLQMTIVTSSQHWEPTPAPFPQENVPSFLQYQNSLPLNCVPYLDQQIFLYAKHAVYHKTPKQITTLMKGKFRLKELSFFFFF